MSQEEQKTSLVWTGERHREMYDFLTNYKKTEEYMTAYEDTFFIDHNMVKGGLVLRNGSELTLVHIGQTVVKTENGFEVISTPKADVNV